MELDKEAFLKGLIELMEEHNVTLIEVYGDGGYGDPARIEVSLNNNFFTLPEFISVDILEKLSK